MPATMWRAGAPYKNTRDTIGVNGGLNEVQSPGLILDNQASELINFDSIGDDALQSISEKTADSSIALSPNEYVCAVKTDQVGNTLVLTAIQDAPPTAERIIFNGVSLDVSASSFQIGDIHIVVFNTSNNSFFVISSVIETRIMAYNVNLGTIATGTLPEAYAKCIEVHANRIFIITGFNKLWWTKAGTYGINGADWYGGVSTENYVAEDSGYWIIENETALYHIAKFNSYLLIFSSENIYALSGYAPENFTVVRLYSGIGCNNSKGFTHPTFSSDRMFFMYGKYIYELSGDYRPRVINTPIFSNGAITNGITGGFDVTLMDASSIGITSDDSYVYIYHSSMLPAWIGTDKSRIYRYDILRGKWSKISGFTISPSADYTQTDAIVPSSHPLVWIRQYYGTPDSVASVYNDSPETSNVATYESSAFSFGPFAMSVLGAIWLQRNIPGTEDVSIYVSFSDSGDDWILITRYENDTTHGVTQTSRTLVPRLTQTSSQFMRIKIEATGDGITIYPYVKETRAKVRN